MAIIKLGDLTTFTGDASGSWLVMNDPTNTTTYKVERETLLSGYVNDTGSFATLGSNQFNGSQSINGDVTASNALFTGNITAQTLVVQTITSSVEYVTGSTKFGSLSTDTHQFTGSVNVTSSLIVNGNVGINTNSPRAPLEVVGNIIAKSGSNLVIYNPETGWSGAMTVNDGYHTVLNGKAAGIDGGTGQIAIGGTVTADTNGSNFNIALGYSTSCTNGPLRSIAIGYGAIANGTNTVALGYGANAPAGTFVLNAGGAERMRIDSSGNLMIGHPTASYKFQVSGSGTSGSLNVDNTLYVSGSNVGIGTSSPSSYKLDVNGTARTQQLHSFSQGTLLDATSTNYFYSVNTGGSTYGGLALRNQIQDYTGYIQTGRSGNSNGIVFWHTSYAGAASGNGHQKFASTTVQFGSLSLPNTLTIYLTGGGNGQVNYPLILNNQLNTTNTGVGLILQTGDENGTGPINHGAISAFKNNFAPGFVTSNLRFLTISDGANTLAEKMRISDSGNLLIGNSTDSGHKLLVSGSGASGSLNVNNVLVVSGSSVQVTGSLSSTGVVTGTGTNQYTGIAATSAGATATLGYGGVGSSGGTTFDILQNGSAAIGVAQGRNVAIGAGGNTANDVAMLYVTGSPQFSAATTKRGVYFNNTLTATENNDVLVGLDVNPTFSTASYTGVSSFGIRINSSGSIFSGTTLANASYVGFAYFYAPNLTTNQTAAWYFGKASSARNNAQLGFTWVGDNSTSNYVSLAFNSVATPALSVFASNNVSINSSTDSGYKLDVNGTARISGNTTISGSLTASGSSHIITGSLGINGSTTIDNTLYVSSNNVGIGITSSAAYKLDVNGTARVQGNSFVVGNNAGANGTVQFYTNGGSRGVVINSNGAIGNLYSAGDGIVYGNIYVSKGVSTDLRLGSDYIGGTSYFVIENNANNRIYIKSPSTIIAQSNGTYEASSLLTLESTTKGILTPRMTAAQRTAISAPAQGLQVYDTGSATEGIWYYNSGSLNSWTRVLNDSGSQVLSGSLTVSGSVTVNGGSITMPNRPAFRVSGSSLTGISATTTITATQGASIDYNQGGYYNNTTGIFTAPVAGLYNVYFNCRTQTAGGQQVIIYKNTSVAQIMWETNTNTGHFGVSSILYLAANDTLEAKVTVGTVQFDANDNWGAAYIG